MAYAPDTPTDQIQLIVARARKCFVTGSSMSMTTRKTQLTRLLALVQENTVALIGALVKDLRRHPSFSAKILGSCASSIRLAINSMDQWAKVQVKPSVHGHQCEVRSQPKGVVLIIGTWNFPCPLVLKPLASALAAGNTAVVKLNEVCVSVSSLFGQLLPKYMDPDIVQVVQGGIPQATALLKQKFDLIFYTGNTTVGRIVLAAAAKHLTPCILELGGKNPVIVAADANIDVAARKIIDGRFKNAGQFCVAPDYVLCDRKVRERLVKAMAAALRSFFGPNPKESASFGRIASRRHCERLLRLLRDPKRGGTVVTGDATSHDVDDRYIAPTIITEPSVDSALMQEEIFGPILPVLAVASVGEAVAFVNARSRPLALYVFSGSADCCDRVINTTHSGGACVNDVIVHSALRSRGRISIPSTWIPLQTWVDLPAVRSQVLELINQCLELRFWILNAH